MSDVRACYETLTAAGGPFEMIEEKVLGEPMQVLARRPRALPELLRQSEGHGDREFLVMGDRRMRFDEHRAAVAGLARTLAERHGVGRGDRVAILAANAPEWIVSFFSITSLGAIAVALNGWWSTDEIHHALEDSEPKLLIGDAKRLARVDRNRTDVTILDFEKLPALWQVEADLPEVALDEDDPACILYTSGTTGRAKGAVLSHRSFLASVGLQTLNGAAMFMASGATTPPAPPCTLLTSPLFHVSGLVAGVVMMLAAGAKVVMREGRFDPVDVMRLIERERVTSWSTTPTLAHRVVNHSDVGNYDLSSLSHLGSGGSALSPDLQERMRERVPSAAKNVGLGYGLTESGGIATINSGDDLVRFPASSGRAMPSVEVEVRDAEGRPVPDGVNGEVHVRSPLVMLGYWRNEEATREAIAPGRWLRTGDIGHLEDGHLFIDSRARDLILRGGENIYPVEVEHALETHPDVDEAAVVGDDDPEWGQVVHAHVVPRDGAQLDVDDVKAWVGGRLAAFKVPSRVTVRPDPLPRNAAGKLVKAELASAPAAKA